MGKLSMMIGILCLLLTAAPQGAFAKGPGFFGERGFKAYRVMFSDEQNKQLDVLVEKFEKEIKPLRNTAMQQHQELRVMMKDPAVPENALKAQVMKGAETVSQMVVKRAEMLRSVRKIATPDQLAKIDAYEAKQHQERAKRLEQWEKFSHNAG